nr:hypothetical protein BaRGS_026525 [Batillaria attramentaria]
MTCSTIARVTSTAVRELVLAVRGNKPTPDVRMKLLIEWTELLQQGLKENGRYNQGHMNCPGTWVKCPYYYYYHYYYYYYYYYYMYMY